jgi:transcriptional regulator with XRE-family HTH domain
VDYPQVDFYREMDNRARYDSGMADDLSTMLSEIMDLTGETQAKLAKRLSIAQSSLNRWLNDKCDPSAKQVEKVRAAWYKAKGVKLLSLDQKLAPYDDDTQSIVHNMVDNYLKNLPPSARR